MLQRHPGRLSEGEAAVLGEEISFLPKLHFYTSCIFCVFISAVQKVQVRMTILHLLLIFTKIEDFAF